MIVGGPSTCCAFSIFNSHLPHRAAAPPVGRPVVKLVAVVLLSLIEDTPDMDQPRFQSRVPGTFRSVRHNSMAVAVPANMLDPDLTGPRTGVLRPEPPAASSPLTTRVSACGHRLDVRAACSPRGNQSFLTPLPLGRHHIYPLRTETPCYWFDLQAIVSIFMTQPTWLAEMVLGFCGVTAVMAARCCNKAWSRSGITVELIRKGYRLGSRVREDTREMAEPGFAAFGVLGFFAHAEVNRIRCVNKAWSESSPLSRGYGNMGYPASGAAGPNRGPFPGCVTQRAREVHAGNRINNRRRERQFTTTAFKSQVLARAPVRLTSRFVRRAPDDPDPVLGNHRLTCRFVRRARDDTAPVSANNRQRQRVFTTARTDVDACAKDDGDGEYRNEPKDFTAGSSSVGGAARTVIDLSANDEGGVTHVDKEDGDGAEEDSDDDTASTATGTLEGAPTRLRDDDDPDRDAGGAAPRTTGAGVPRAAGTRGPRSSGGGDRPPHGVGSSSSGSGRSRRRGPGKPYVVLRSGVSGAKDLVTPLASLEAPQATKLGKRPRGLATRKVPNAPTKKRRERAKLKWCGFCLDMKVGRCRKKACLRKAEIGVRPLTIVESVIGTREDRDGASLDAKAPAGIPVASTIRDVVNVVSVAHRGDGGLATPAREDPFAPSQDSVVAMSTIDDAATMPQRDTFMAPEVVCGLSELRTAVAGSDVQAVDDPFAPSQDSVDAMSTFDNAATEPEKLEWNFTCVREVENAARQRVLRIGQIAAFDEDVLNLANKYGKLAADGRAYLASLTPDTSDDEGLPSEDVRDLPKDDDFSWSSEEDHERAPMQLSDFLRDEPESGTVVPTTVSVSSSAPVPAAMPCVTGSSRVTMDAECGASELEPAPTGTRLSLSNDTTCASCGVACGHLFVCVTCTGDVCTDCAGSLNPASAPTGHPPGHYKRGGLMWTTCRKCSAASGVHADGSSTGHEPPESGPDDGKDDMNTSDRGRDDRNDGIDSSDGPLTSPLPFPDGVNGEDKGGATGSTTRPKEVEHPKRHTVHYVVRDLSVGVSGRAALPGENFEDSYVLYDLSGVFGPGRKTDWASAEEFYTQEFTAALGVLAGVVRDATNSDYYYDRIRRRLLHNDTGVATGGRGASEPRTTGSKPRNWNQNVEYPPRHEVRGAMKRFGVRIACDHQVASGCPEWLEIYREYHVDPSRALYSVSMSNGMHRHACNHCHVHKSKCSAPGTVVPVLHPAIELYLLKRVRGSVGKPPLSYAGIEGDLKQHLRVSPFIHCSLPHPGGAGCPGTRDADKKCKRCWHSENYADVAKSKFMAGAQQLPRARHEKYTRRDGRAAKATTSGLRTADAPTTIHHMMLRNGDCEFDRAMFTTQVESQIRHRLTFLNGDLRSTPGISQPASNSMADFWKTYREENLFKAYSDFADDPNGPKNFDVYQMRLVGLLYRQRSKSEPGANGGKNPKRTHAGTFPGLSVDDVGGDATKARSGADQGYEMVAVVASLASLMVSVKAWACRRVTGGVVLGLDHTYNCLKGTTNVCRPPPPLPPSPTPPFILPVLSPTSLYPLAPPYAPSTPRAHLPPKTIEHSSRNSPSPFSLHVRCISSTRA